MTTRNEIEFSITSKQQYNYRGQLVIFKSINDHPQGIVFIDVLIDGKPQTFEKEKGDTLDLFLANFKPVIVEEERESKPKSDLPALVSPHPGPVILQKHSNAFDKIANMLMEDMEKLRGNPEYVPQAKQSANTANAIINLAKLELDMMNRG